MAITSQPFVRFTSFNFWLVGLRALYQLGHLPTTGPAMAPLADPLDPRLVSIEIMGTYAFRKLICEKKCLIQCQF